MAGQLRFKDRVALVSGASSGIGRACALALGAEGACVVAAGRRRERLDEVVTRIEAAGGRAVKGNRRSLPYPRPTSDNFLASVHFPATFRAVPRD